jgi:hypothetical protein
MIAVPTSDPGFVAALPNTIDDMEQFLYRELQLLNTITTDSSTTFVAGNRRFNLPSANGTFVVVSNIYAITPVGTSNPDLGTRNALTPASREFIDASFPASAGSGIPQYFAPSSQTTFIVGPWPDQSYYAEVHGTYRPTPLGTANVTTLLSVYFPDLTISASLAFLAAYQQNFGAAGYVDNPQMGPTWMAHTRELLKSAQTEEAMKKFTSEGWSSKAPAPLATPPRT